MMFKKVVFILIMIFIFSISYSAYGQNFIPYQNPQKGFSIQVPADWQQSGQDLYGQEVIYFISPMESQQDYFQENISIMIFPLQYQMDLEALANMYAQQSQYQIPNLQVVQTQNITIGNVPAKYALYTGSMQQMNMAFLVVYIINQNQAYILQCTSDANKYQQYQSIFSQVLGSFSFMAVQPTPFQQQQQPFQQQQKQPFQQQQQQPFQQQQQQPFQQQTPLAPEQQLPLIPEQTPQTGLPQFDQPGTQQIPQTQDVLPQFD